MPEGPELHLSSLIINRICRDVIFSGKVARNPIHKCAEIEWDEPAYTITAESQGKELMLHLKTVKKSDELSSKTNSCENGTKKPALVKFTEEGNRSKESTTSILFTFGMSGKFEWTPVSEMLKHSHLSFFANTYPGNVKGAMALSFVDYRRFGKWYQNADWSKERGPCVIGDFNGFVKNIAENLDHKAFQRPICEVMLDQKFFSGIGNYLRAEILFRCGVAPFERAIQVVKASEGKENFSETPETQVLKKVGKKKGNKKEVLPLPAASKADDEIKPSLNLFEIKCEPYVGGNVGSAMQTDSKGAQLEKDGNDMKNSQFEWSHFSRKGEELLRLCHSVPLEVVQLGSSKYMYSLTQLYHDKSDESPSFDDWLQCYYQDGMKNLSDHNKRTIWFSGPAGPLVPKDSKSRGKKTTKKASKDLEVNAKPGTQNFSQSTTESHTKEAMKGRMTRKQLEALKHSEVKNSDSVSSAKQKEKRGRNQNTKVSDRQGSLPKSDFKRKRKVQAVENKSDQVKKRRKDSSDIPLLKTEHKRATRSRLLRK